MPPAYVRTLFDHYAPRFDQALAELSYRAPALLFDALETVCRAGGRDMRLGPMLDLGCGTGLGGVAFRPCVDWLVGVDLSPGMIEQARRKGLYDRLATEDIARFLAAEIAGSASFHLIIAADVLTISPASTASVGAVARVLAPKGIFAFTVETHSGEGVILGEKLRYAHGADHVRAAIAGAGLTLRHWSGVLDPLGKPRSGAGLLVVAERQ